MGDNLPVPAEPVQPVSVEEPGNQLPIESFLQTRLPAFASFDFQQEDGRRQLLKMMGIPDGSLLDFQKQTLTVTQIAIFRQEGRVSNDGEIADKTKVAFLLDDGRILKFASPSAVNTLREIIVSKGGLPRVTFPLKLYVRAEKGDAPGPYFVFEERGEV